MASKARAIAIGTLAVGTLDITSAFVFFGLWRGVTPIRILQSVASGLLGRDSYTGGAATALLGAVLHYFISFCIVTAYVLISERLVFLRRAPVPWGLLYGVAVFFVMSFVVVPLSAAGTGPHPWPWWVFGLAGHAVFIGLPAALAANRVPSTPRTLRS